MISSNPGIEVVYLYNVLTKIHLGELYPVHDTEAETESVSQPVELEATLRITLSNFTQSNFSPRESATG